MVRDESCGTGPRRTHAHTSYFGRRASWRTSLRRFLLPPPFVSLNHFTLTSFGACQTFSNFSSSTSWRVFEKLA